MQLDWIKCNDENAWCPFATVNMSTVSTYGVYIIWYLRLHINVVYVGQGDVADRIAAHRRDQRITRHAQNGNLLVTWASVPATQRDGVERYLANKYPPLEGENHPVVEPITVNIPWN